MIAARRTGAAARCHELGLLAQQIEASPFSMQRAVTADDKDGKGDTST